MPLLPLASVLPSVLIVFDCILSLSYTGGQRSTPLLSPPLHPVGQQLLLVIKEQGGCQMDGHPTSSGAARVQSGSEGTNIRSSGQRH
jgi:hypothetical protein